MSALGAAPRDPRRRYTLRFESDAPTLVAWTAAEATKPTPPSSSGVPLVFGYSNRPMLRH
jgi:hypothetical protein